MASIAWTSKASRTWKPVSWGRVALTAYVVLFVLLLLLPILLVVLASFSPSPYSTFPIRSLSLTWYRKALEYGPFMTSLATSLEIAVLSSTLGALFAVPVVRVPGPAAVAELRAGAGVPARLVGVGADPADEPVDAHTFADATIMVFADDGELDARWRDACDEMVRIPAGAMPVTPCAVSVVLYEISRQRRVSVSKVNAGAAGE